MCKQLNSAHPECRYPSGATRESGSRIQTPCHLPSTTMCMTLSSDQGDHNHLRVYWRRLSICNFLSLQPFEKPFYVWPPNSQHMSRVWSAAVQRRLQPFVSWQPPKDPHHPLDRVHKSFTRNCWKSFICLRSRSLATISGLGST